MNKTTADILHPRFTREDISRKVKELAEEISKDYKKLNPVLVCVLKGGVYFFTDLTKEIPFSVEIDFVQAKSYVGTVSTGKIDLLKDINTDLSDRHVILVEDILDTGFTLQYLVRHIFTRNPASLEIVTLLLKERKNILEFPVKYVGWRIPDEFVVGYGLDFDGKYRNLPDIHLLEPGEYSV
ncbi:hypoxanthine phosphoribosyltransferase [Leptospira gomenensis]|uniref:Hypoxanthine phosphoribosyltransferase n=1 Tax=Leptospira gomenensis TaxID=2484974 RepID=A0A5F1Y5G9_9LEPT|nr:hypoxanthine phosphoribosyltransferase [Leptospira gomenensis]TGK27933.1 hypoxanthine phosphoribosyltransferase [Leptospira gomenensis]TGK45461.1 hypoxanthine phosphoribosyltransferase [Leptospira gomenensis]TGK45848.1 hypoxanthine phosphoribosyltransferase [Leptospira gomenensis]TGK65226.1 hypoxanthine phosphoribosyltransferase [Leptospira gomenensis]